MGRTRDARRVIKVPAVWAGRRARIEGGWCDPAGGYFARHCGRESMLGIYIDGPSRAVRYLSRAAGLDALVRRYPFRRLNLDSSTPIYIYIISKFLGVGTGWVPRPAAGRGYLSIAATAGYFQQHERLGYDPQGSHNTPVEPEQRLSVLLELEAAPLCSEGTILMPA
jgi:hypothetical protein